METLAPPLRLLQAVRYAIESGESLRQGLSDYLQLPPDDLNPHVRAWLQLLERQCSTQEFLLKLRSPSRRHLLGLLERGFQGEPVLTALVAMEDELQEQSLMEIDEFLAHLPFRMLLPLLFFLFPAFLLLLLGPLLISVVSGVG